MKPLHIVGQPIDARMAIRHRPSTYISVVDIVELGRGLYAMRQDELFGSCYLFGENFIILGNAKSSSYQITGISH